MKLGSGLLVAIFYPVVVISAVLLLAVVQMRSTGGSALDTWMVNHRANRALDTSLATRYKDARTNVNQNRGDIAFTEACLKFYSTDGILKSGIDKQVLDAAEAARKAGKKTDEMEANDVKCLDADL